MYYNLFKCSVYYHYFIIIIAVIIVSLTNAAGNLTTPSTV